MMDTLHKKFEDEKRNKIEAEKLKGRSDNDAGRAWSELLNVQNQLSEKDMQNQLLQKEKE